MGNCEFKGRPCQETLLVDREQQTVWHLLRRMCAGGGTEDPIDTRSIGADFVYEQTMPRAAAEQYSQRGGRLLHIHSCKKCCDVVRGHLRELGLLDENGPAPKRVADAIERARVLERIAPDDLTDEERKERVQFGNNFHLLFVALQLEGTNTKGWLQDRLAFYLRRARALGEPWEEFLSRNQTLIAEIHKANDDEMIYRNAFTVIRDFWDAKDFEGAETFEHQIDPQLGIKAIEVPVWRRLNTLLEQAHEAMVEVGIDSTQFYS